MLSREQLLKEQSQLQEKLTKFKNEHNNLPDDPITFEVNFRQEYKQMDDNWKALLKEIAELEKNIRTKGYNAERQELEKQKQEKVELRESIAKRSNEYKNKHHSFVNGKVFTKYEGLYSRLKDVNEALAKLEAETQPVNMQVEVVSLPESKQDFKQSNQKLPQWVTSVASKTIHLSANLLKTINKEWLEKFAAQNNLTLSPLQEDQKMKLISTNNAQEVITIEKNSLSATFGEKDTDRLVKVIIDLYIQAVKDLPCEKHTIKSTDSKLQSRFEEALRTALEANKLINDRTTLNDKEIGNAFSQDNLNEKNTRSLGM